MFTSQDIEEINRTIKAFPPATEISVGKINGDNVGYYGAIKQDKLVKETENNHSIFEIGSITKILTSTILSQMVLEGLVKTEEEIGLKLGFSLKNNSKITFKELSTHSSGLPSVPFKFLIQLLFSKNDNPYRDFSEEKLIKYLKNDLKLKNKGSFRYSNLGVGLLGYLLSKYSKQSYNDLLKRRVFTPFHMNESTTIREEVSEKLVVGLNKKGLPAKNWDLNILAGAGAVLSSTADLSKFLIENIKNKNKALNYQRQCAFEKGKQAMGLGWFILKDKIPNIDKAYFHNGGTGGYTSSMVADFEKGCGIVILSNVSGAYLFKANKVDHLAYNLLKNNNKDITR